MVRRMNSIAVLNPMTPLTWMQIRFPTVAPPPLIFVLVLVAILLIAMIRRGKPPTDQKYSDYSEKEHIKF